jgi:hypothetical protein
VRIRPDSAGSRHVAVFNANVLICNANLVELSSKSTIAGDAQVE